MGRPQQYEVRLTEEQREALARLIRTGTQPAHTRRRAQILLKVDAARPDAMGDVQVAKALDLHAQTAAVVRKQFVAEGLDATWQAEAEQADDRIGSWMESKKHVSSH
ncbi:MAG: hypothetical protein U0531_22550 [Dehalococcoidia bacterium]